MIATPINSTWAAKLGRVLLGLLGVAGAMGEASAQQLLFPENVEAVELVEAEMRRRATKQFDAAEGDVQFTVELGAQIQAEALPIVAAPAAAAAPVGAGARAEAAEKVNDAKDAEAKAIAAHRAKADAARVEALTKLAKDRDARITASKLGEQVMRQIGIEARPAPAAPAAVVAPAAVQPVIRHEVIQIQRQNEAGQVVVEMHAVPVMVPAVPQAIVGEPAALANLNPNEQQFFRNFFQPLLERELQFTTSVCGLDETQSKSLTEAANEQILVEVRAYAKAQQQPRRVVNVNGVQRVEPPMVQPRELTEKCVVASLKKAKLSDAVIEQYTEESARRVEFRKQAGIEAFVAAIDDRLFLDAQQREKLTAILEKHWQEGWAPYVDSMLYNSQLYPPIPNELLLPILRQEQKDVWQAAQNSGTVRVLHRNMLPVWNALPAQGR